MKSFICILLLSSLITGLLVLPGFSQDTPPKSPKGQYNTDTKTSGLKKIAGAHHEDMNIIFDIDEEALELSLEKIEQAMESMEKALEKMEISIEPIEINLQELEVNIDPIVIDIPDFDMAMEPIEMDDLGIDLEEISIDRAIHDPDHEKTFHQEGEKKSGSSDNDSKGKSKGLKKIN